MSVLYKGSMLRVSDAHTHIYPDKIAEKATAAVGAFYDIPMSRIGMSEALLAAGQKNGTDRYLVCSVATKPEQVASINTYIAGECAKHPAFVGLGALHHQLQDPLASIEHACELGLRGFKVHPDFQKFNIDDPALLPVYRILAARKLPILFHMGDNRYDYSAPIRLARVLDRVPDLRCIGAHFGGYRRWREAERVLRGADLYFDTSSSLPYLGKEEALEIIHVYGADRMFFGTDFPMWDPKEELDRFLALDLPVEEAEKILYGNFAAFFGLPEA